MKLGKLPAVYDARTLMLAKYLQPTFTAPVATTWGSRFAGNWGMMKNDTVGDCTCAAAGHMNQLWTFEAQGKMVTPSDAAILAMYSAVTGYNPADPSTDRGANMLAVLKYWRNKGLGITLRDPRHLQVADKIGGFASVSPRATAMAKAAIFMFGGLYTGFALPKSAQSQDVWDLAPGGTLTEQGAPGSWGGHCVLITKYDQYFLECITWGSRKRMTWSFFKAYCDESYAIFDSHWISKNGQAPSGIDADTLRADLAKF